MQRFASESPDRLVFTVRSPLENAMGVVGLGFLAWTAAHGLMRPGDTDRLIALVAASATCLLFWLVSESGDYVFDAAAGRLDWTRRFGFFRSSGSLPLADIQGVTLNTAPGASRLYPKQRIVLLTLGGEFALTMKHHRGADHVMHVERLRAFLDRLPAAAGTIAPPGP